MSQKPLCECNQGRLPCTCKPQHPAAQLQQEQNVAHLRITVLENAYIRAGEREHALRVELHAVRQKLAALDALLRDVMDGKHTTPGWNQRMKAALSASAEPSAGTCIDSNPCGGPAGHCRWCKHPVTPVERDERADFDEWFRKEKGLHPESCTTYIDAAFMPYRAWQARAALDNKPTESLRHEL